MRPKETPFQKHQNREPAFAGKFYPGSEKKLLKQLEELFAEAKKNTKGQKKPRAIISPHAGYIFSGRVAASAFNQIPENTTYKKVFVLAPSHQSLFDGASVYDTGNYFTPLGEIKVDTETATWLTENSGFFQSKPEAHQFEHSLEVQLPFLQHKLGNNFSMVPVILGTDNPDDCKHIAKTLEPYFTPENLFVISTDFSHFPEYNEAVETDLLTAEAICANKPEQLLRVLEENKKKNIDNLVTSLCGWTPVLTLLYLTENKKVKYKKIDYKNSGDSEPYGDKDRVVGYWALSVFDGDAAFSISEEERKELLNKARHAITKYVKTGKRGKPVPPEKEGILNEPTGAFVSIYVNGELRGCTGNFAQEKTLNDLVQRMAVSAACDQRFEDLHADELDSMELEISVLSPLKKVESINEIEPGKHGIYIKKGLNSGTFLPQVAQKTGWNLDEFLGHCARDKAGLGWEGWKTAELFTYEAFIFRS